jgi:hypothetical protein
MYYFHIKFELISNKKKKEGVNLCSYHGKDTGSYPHSLNQDEEGRLCEHMRSEHIQVFHLPLGISPTARRNNLSAPEIVNATYSDKHMPVRDCLLKLYMGLKLLLTEFTIVSSFRSLEKATGYQKFFRLGL